MVCSCGWFQWYYCLHCLSLASDLPPAVAGFAELGVEGADCVVGVMVNPGQRPGSG